VGRDRRRKSSTWPLSRPARSRSARGGRFACRPVRRRPARRPRTSGRAGRGGPYASPCRDGSCRPRPFRERVPTVERPRTVALARPAGVASDRERRASSTARSEVGAAAVGRSHPGGRGPRSSGSNTSPPAAAAATSRFRHRSVRHSAAAWASSEAAGVAPAAWPRSFRRSRRSSRHQAVAERPATPPGLSRPLAGRSSEPRSPSYHQVWEPLPRNGDRLGHSIGL
jgi:hypothetical protein